VPAVADTTSTEPPSKDQLVAAAKYYGAQAADRAKAIAIAVGTKLKGLRS